jgi:hypothetical protein
MEFDQDQLRNLLRNPRESLDVEIKPWLDPTKPEDIAKIAKACIAFRNHDGGCLQIGFTDDCKPDVANARAIAP